MIELNHVTKRYWTQNIAKQAVKDVTVQLPQGQIIGLFGENGAGKTTLMKCILGFLSYQGSITLDGAPIDRRNIHRLSFATSEHSFFPHLTAQDHREFYRHHFPAFRDDRFRVLMDFFRLPMGQEMGHCSTGQKNQFELILAMSQGADYILMDEPFAGNDIFNREDFYKLLLGMLEERETVLLSTHLIEEVQHFVGRALLLREGELVGDCSVTELEEQGKSLVDYVKETYQYRSGRVLEALDRLEQDGEGRT